jgi:hypothetical protein
MIVGTAALTGLIACGGGGGGDGDDSSSTGQANVDCKWVDDPCTKQLVAALDAGGKCFNHGSLCPADASQCGNLVDDNNCTWADGTKVFFPEGWSNNIFSFSITGSGGQQCYTSSGNLLTMGAVTLSFPTQGNFVEQITPTGIRIQCPDGTSVEATIAAIEQCPGAPKAADSTICCSSGAMRCPTMGS